MKPTRKTNQVRPGWASTTPGAGGARRVRGPVTAKRRLLVLVVLAVVNGIMGVGQEPPGLNQTNGLAPTNGFDDALKPRNLDGIAPTNTVAPTNSFVETNALPGTNEIGLTNQLLQTNTVVQTNEVTSTNEAVSSETPAETNTSVQASKLGSAGGSRRVDYNSFRIITDRNIFDPNRVSRSGRFTRRETRRPTRVDSFGLVGTMSYEKGTYAFFNGSSYDYRKALQLGDVISGYKITAIAQNHVKLASPTNEFELRVNMQMRREDGGEWKLAASAESYASPSPAVVTPSVSTASASTSTNAESGTAADSGESATSAAPSAAASGGESDILKKLMQRREQEMNK